DDAIAPLPAVAPPRKLIYDASRQVIAKLNTGLGFIGEYERSELPPVPRKPRGPRRKETKTKQQS
ncbi:MAG: hypothetical protein ACXVP5_06555, partial [Tumebacillaceae bacterium]